MRESGPGYRGNGARRRSDIPERLLARLWQRRAARRAWFRAHGGQRVRVIYPGRPGLTAGPDFRDALLEVEGVGLVRGDVEIHIRQQDWSAHGHGDDPRYNGVGATRSLGDPASGHQAAERRHGSSGLVGVSGG